MEENRPAGFWVRLGATLLDGLIVGMPLVLISYFITGTMEETWVTYAGNLIYTILLPVVWSGYTVGKRMVNIRIVRIDGNKLGLGTMLMRNVVAGILYGLTFGILVIVSAFMVGLRKDKRAIHDFVARTQVVHVN